MSTLYVMGYWPIKNNPKNSLEHYEKHRRATLDLLAQDEYGTVCEISNKDIAVNHLITWEIAEAFTQAAERAPDVEPCPEGVDPYVFYNRNKTEIHKWRDLRPSRDVYKKMLTIWLSKVYLVYSLARTKDFDRFAWVDASFSRFNREFMHYDVDECDSIIHYPSNMIYMGEKLPVNASFLLGSTYAWENLWRVYHYALQVLPNLDICMDEEIVFKTIHAAHPEMFEVSYHATPSE